jgi:hypothetical protein
MTGQAIDRLPCVSPSLRSLPLNLSTVCSPLFILQGVYFLSIIIDIYRYARLKK